MKYATYQFSNLKKPLPEDVNAPVEKDIAERFKSKGLDERLKKWRERRRFGDVSFMSQDQKMACAINFQGGIVIRYHLIKRELGIDGLFEEKWSIMNENIDLKTHKREKDGTNG
jgi:hypothetical protein